MAVKKTRVLSVDDHAIVARGLRASVEIEPDLEWAGWIESADKLFETVDRLRPDVVLMDVDMPGAEPFKAVQELSELRPNARVIMLSAFARDAYVDSAVSAGAWGYLSKGDDFDKIVHSIRRVAAGDLAFPPEALSRCETTPDGKLRLLPSAAPGMGVLSPREVQVLRMIAQGQSTKDIAAAIHRSVKRVESIRTDLMRKLGVQDRVELTRYAIREGLIEP